MTLTRTIGLLGGTLAILLLVVALRSETARVHYQISQIDREIEGWSQQVRENGLEIVRLRNPALIMKSAEAIRMARSPGPAGSTAAAAAVAGGR